MIDFHTHIFPPSVRSDRQKYLERDATFGELYADPKARTAGVVELLLAMDEDGVDTSVVMGIGWKDYGLGRECNDYIIEAARLHPDRVVGFASVNPAWGDRAALEADRCARAGLRGVGELHPDSQSFDLGDSGTMAPLAEAVREHHLIVTTHSSEPVGHSYPGKGAIHPQVLWRFVQNFPDLTVVCAHWGGGLPFYALMPEVAARLGNVFFDSAASPFLYTGRVFSAVAEVVGPEKILLGSDFPLMRTSRILSQLEESTLSEERKEMVKTSNAAALLWGLA